MNTHGFSNVDLVTAVYADDNSARDVQKLRPKGPRPAAPIGRPSAFDQDVADAICTGLAAGKSMRQILKAEGMPARSTVFRWLKERETFQAQYTAARQNQTNLLSSEIARLEKDVPSISDAAPQQIRDAKAQLQAVKRRAGQLAPKRYQAQSQA